MGNLLKLTLILFTFALGNDIFVVSGTQCLPKDMDTTEQAAAKVGNMVTNALSKRFLGMEGDIIYGCPPFLGNQNLEYCCNFKEKTECCELSTYIFNGLYNNIVIVMLFVTIIITSCVLFIYLRRR